MGAVVLVAFVGCGEVVVAEPGVAGLGVAVLGVAVLGVTGLDVAVLGVAVLDVAGLGVAGLETVADAVEAALDVCGEDWQAAISKSVPTAHAAPLVTRTDVRAIALFSRSIPPLSSNGTVPARI